MDCKVGDRVHVAGTVMGFQGGSPQGDVVIVHLDDMNNIQRQYVHRSAIVHVEPRLIAYAGKMEAEMDVKEGDTVHLRMTVHRVSGKVIKFKCTDGTIVEGLLEHIAAVERHPIAEGDTVCQRANPRIPHMERMEVYAIRDGRAWCLSSGYDYIIPVGELERVT